MSKITRRGFLQALGAVVGFSVLPKLDIPNSPVAPKPVATKLNISQELLDDAENMRYMQINPNIPADGDMQVVGDRLGIWLGGQIRFFSSGSAVE